MPSISLAFIQIILGSLMIALGYHEFKVAARPDGERLLDQIDGMLFPSLSDETMIQLRKACALMLVLTGVGICVASMF